MTIQPSVRTWRPCTTAWFPVPRGSWPFASGPTSRRENSSTSAAPTGSSRTPSACNTIRFQEEEYAILQMLDGDISLDEIKERFEADFPPQKITLEELQQFLGMLHRTGLVLVSAPGQGRELRRRRSERSARNGSTPSPTSSASASKASTRSGSSIAALPLGPLVLFPAGRGRLRALRPFRGDLGGRPVRRLLLEASRLPPVLQFPQRLVAFRRSGRDEGLARVRPRAVVQALRRRVPRDGRDDPRLDALPVLQRLRLVDAAEQVAPARPSAPPACTSNW